MSRGLDGLVVVESVKVSFRFFRLSMLRWAALGGEGVWRNKLGFDIGD